MSTTITRLYRTEQQALGAVAELKGRGGFRDGEISLVRGEPEGAAPDLERLIGRICAGDVPRSHARRYAEAVQGGALLITVRAPPFTALRATGILRRFEPLPPLVEEPDVYRKAELGGLPKLWRRRPSAVLLHTPPAAGLLPSDAYFSSLFGLPLIIKDARPWSRVITDARPWSRVITDARPWSKLLSGTLSSWLGIPTILRDDARGGAVVR